MMKQCPLCGSTISSDNAMYCDFCGANLNELNSIDQRAEYQNSENYSPAIENRYNGPKVGMIFHYIYSISTVWCAGSSIPSLLPTLIAICFGGIDAELNAFIPSSVIGIIAAVIAVNAR